MGIIVQCVAPATHAIGSVRKSWLSLTGAYMVHVTILTKWNDVNEVTYGPLESTSVNRSVQSIKERFGRIYPGIEWEAT